MALLRSCVPCLKVKGSHGQNGEQTGRAAGTEVCKDGSPGTPVSTSSPPPRLTGQAICGAGWSRVGTEGPALPMLPCSKADAQQSRNSRWEPGLPGRCEERPVQVEGWNVF